MAKFFKTSTLWVVDFLYDGRARRWFRAFGPNDNVPRLMHAQLSELCGERARLVETREATDEEELEYLRGEEPRNIHCPTGRTDLPDHLP